MKKCDIAIVGGGPAGRVIAKLLYQSKLGIHVLWVRDAASLYERCAIPYGFGHDKKLEDFRLAAKELAGLDVELLEDRVTEIDTRGYELGLEGGDRIGYGRLVLATGATARLPDLPGVDAENVFALRSLNSLEALQRHVKSAERIAVIGGTAIGTELSAMLAVDGHHVLLVDAAERLLSTILPEEDASSIQEELQAHGVSTMLGASPIELQKKGDLVHTLVFDDGSSVPVDLVIFALGEQPDTDLARSAGIETSPYGIVTDAQMRTSVENIWATGECVVRKSLLTGQPVATSNVSQAIATARVVGMNLLGHSVRFPGVMPSTVSTVLGKSYALVGLSEAEARAAGYDLQIGRSVSQQRTRALGEDFTMRTTLLFDATTRKLLGGSILRDDHAAPQSADFLSLALQLGAGLHDLLDHQCIIHPAMKAEPTDNPFAEAARFALETAKLIP